MQTGSIKQFFISAAISVTVSVLLFPATVYGGDEDMDRPPAYATYNIDPKTGTYTSNKPPPEKPPDSRVQSEAVPEHPAQSVKERSVTPAVIGAALLLAASAAFILAMRRR